MSFKRFLFFILSPSLIIQIEYKDLASTLEKLKAQHPSLYIPSNQPDGSECGDNSESPYDIKPLNDLANATPMDISRLVTHLSKVVAKAREEVSTLLHELQPLKETIIVLKDDCDEKKKVRKMSYAVVHCFYFILFFLFPSTLLIYKISPEKQSLENNQTKKLPAIGKSQTYNALQTQLNTEYALIQSELSETENSIRDLEATWKHLQVMYITKTKNLMAAMSVNKRSDLGTV